MRIIDKNTDFYDYLQNVYRDDSLTFDRTDSFILSKEEMCRHIYGSIDKPELHDNSFVLLQICNTFWLFLTDLTEIHNNKYYSYDIPADYDMELLATWKNYNKSRELCRLDIISFKFALGDYLSRRTQYGYRYTKYKYNREKILDRLDTLKREIDTNNYRVEKNINRQRVALGNGSWEERHIPLLKACGFAKLIDPLEIYLAFEEYFSLDKTVSERTESVGITDKEKIENHGFDTKVSFRGKL